MTDRNFRSIKFDTLLPPKADPDRVGLVAAGNPDVLREAHGLEPYARKRKRGGRAKRKDAGKVVERMSGGAVRPRLDRPSRRKKFDDGGAAIPYGGKSYVPYVPLDHSKTTIPSRPTPQQEQPYPDNFGAQLAAGLGGLGKGISDLNKNKPVDLGYALYDNGTPVGIVGVAPFAQKRGGRVRKARKRGGRAEISGAHRRHRLDRRSRRKFADGGAADDDDHGPQPTAPAAARSWLPPRYRLIGQGADAINRGAEAVGRGVAAGLMAIDKAGHELSGSKPAYRRGGRTHR